MADPGEVTHTPWSQRVRSLLLGPRGGGTTRRRASDAVRVGLATVLVVICVPLAQANTSVEIHVTELVTPPPASIEWLITAIWLLGSVGVIIALLLVGLLVPRLTAVRQMGVAGLVTLGVCLVLDALLGPAAGRSPAPDLAGFDPRFPVVQLAIATAVALAGLPYLSRPMHRLVFVGISLSTLCAVVGRTDCRSACSPPSSWGGGPQPPATSPWVLRTAFRLPRRSPRPSATSTSTSVA
jgi:hypothetical protein